MVKRIEELDGIRTVAIASVFLHHVLHVRLLWMGVDLFFVLSGFLITGILIDNKSQSLRQYFGRFYRRRARRILPPYLLLLIVTSMVFGVAWARQWYFYFFFMNFVLAFRVPHPQSLNILWSLAVEEQFYLLWPLAVYFLSEEALAWTAAAVVVAAPLLRWFCTPLFAYHWPIYALTPFRMDLLAVGALIAIVWRWHQDRVKKFGHYGLLFTALALLTLLALSEIPGFTTTANTPATNLGIYELSLIACAGTILWALSGRATSILTLSPVRYVGRISYTIYLIHFTIFVLVSRYLHGTWIITGATLAGTLAYAAASWAILEKPILNRRSVSAPSATPETYVGSWSTGNPAIEAMSSILSGERERPSEEKVLLDAFPLPR